MILLDAYNKSIDKEITYYEDRAAECQKYGDDFGAESWLDLVRFTRDKKVESEREESA